MWSSSCQRRSGWCGWQSGGDRQVECRLRQAMVWMEEGWVSCGGFGDITYEVTLRMVRLLFKVGRWIDLRNFDWRLVGERFGGVTGGGAKASVLQSFKSLDDPHSCVKESRISLQGTQHRQPSSLPRKTRPTSSQSRNVVATGRNCFLSFPSLTQASRSGSRRYVTITVLGDIYSDYSDVVVF